MEARFLHNSHSNLWVLVPGATEKVRPILAVERAVNLFGLLGDRLLGLVNGTFFNQLSASLYALGDVKTEAGLALVANQPPLGDGFYFPAGPAPHRAGYENRWSLAEIQGEVRPVQGQPSQENRDSTWAMGGGGLLVRDGALANSAGAGPLGLHDPANGGFGPAQTYATRRSCLLVHSDGSVHLGIQATTAGPAELARAAVELDYRHAVMLDGGGATTLMYRDGNDLEVVYGHPGYDRLHSFLAVLSH